MSLPNPDALYTQLTAHYKGCAVCTSAHDCPQGHLLLMAWGAAEAKAAHSDWWIAEAERSAVRGEPYESLPDLGERSL